MDDEAESPDRESADSSARDGEKFVRSFSKSSPLKPRLHFGSFESTDTPVKHEESTDESKTHRPIESEAPPPSSIEMPTSVEELQRLMGDRPGTPTRREAQEELDRDESTDAFDREDPSDEFEEVEASDPIAIEASPSASLPYRRTSTWSGYLSRWLIRLLFIAALGVVYWLIYRKLAEPPPMPTKAPGTSLTINVPARFYQMRSLGKDWKRVTDKGLASADLVLERESPRCRVWVESRPQIGPPPVKAGLLLELEESWRKSLVGMKEVRRWEDLISGQVTQFLEASGRVDDRSVRRLGGIFAYAGFVYHVVGEADEEGFDSARPELEYALKTVRLLPTFSPHVPAGTHRFSGHAFEYSLEAFPHEWRESAELEVDSRFADLKLVSKDRLRTIVVSPRPDATIESLQELTTSRLQKLHGDRLSLREDVEELTIGGQAARRLQASLQGDSGGEILVLTFIQGTGIAYQIDVRGPSESAATWLPETLSLLDSFQGGSAKPKEGEPTDDKPRENHFQPAPKEFNR